jgi:hypothetical protein
MTSFASEEDYQKWLKAQRDGASSDPASQVPSQVPPLDPTPVVTTHVVTVVDASGSMNPLREFVVDGVNQLLADLDPSVRVTIIQFDTTDPQVVVVDEVPAGEVVPLTIEDYVPGSSTPLYDAVGIAVRSAVGQANQYEVLTGGRAGVVFAIISDGRENASTRFSADQVRKLLERQQEEGWDVRFIGLGVDAFAEGAYIGIREDRTLTVNRSAAGTSEAFLAVSNATTRRPRRPTRAESDDESVDNRSDDGVS